MNNKFKGIKKEYKRRKRKIDGYSNHHARSAIGESFLFGLKLTGILLPLAAGTFITKAGVEAINEKAYEKTMTSDFKTSESIYDKEEIKDKKNAIYEYSSFIQMPDGTYMRTIKTYDPSDKSIKEIARTLKQNPDADIKEFFGEPVEITSEVRDNLMDVDNVNKHYKAKVYKNLSENAFMIIAGMTLVDLLLGLISFTIYDAADPLDTLGDIGCDIRSIKDDYKDYKKERKSYGEQKKEIKALTKSLKI